LDVAELQGAAVCNRRPHKTAISNRRSLMRRVLSQLLEILQRERIMAQNPVSYFADGRIFRSPFPEASCDDH
jgi:hypothetical protein